MTSNYNTTDQDKQIMLNVNDLEMKIIQYIHYGDNELNEIKMLFNENFEKFKDGFLHKFDYMQSYIANCSFTYCLDSLSRADEIIDIMLSYNIMPRMGVFIWGYNTVHLKSLDLALKFSVIKYNNKNHRKSSMDSAMIHIIHSKRPAYHIINAIDIFIKYGYDFNYYNFLISWNLPVLKYILSLVTRPVDYMKELLLGLKHISRSQTLHDVKNVIDYIVKISIGNINQQDNIGCTYLHYICSDYTSLNSDGLLNKPYYEYLIETMILNGADINIVDNDNLTPLDIIPKSCRAVDRKLEIKLHGKLVELVKSIILDREEAIVFVRDVSSVLLPDIANVVFDYCYLFDDSKHHDLAREV